VLEGQDLSERAKPERSCSQFGKGAEKYCKRKDCSIAAQQQDSTPSGHPQGGKSDGGCRKKNSKQRAQMSDT